MKELQFFSSAVCKAVGFRAVQKEM